MSKMHRTVRLAERIAGEDAGKIASQAPTANTVVAATQLPKTERNARLASGAYRKTGQPADDLFAKAIAVRKQFLGGGWILGGFIGLVLGGKLISLARPEQRSIFEPDRATCVACGRCYSYCPKELVKVKRAEKKKSPVVEQPRVSM